MRQIVEGGECNAFLGIMRSSHVVYLSAMQDNGPINVRMAPGSEAPLHSTAMGKIVLAELGDEEVLQRVFFYQKSHLMTDSGQNTEHRRAAAAKPSARPPQGKPPPWIDQYVRSAGEMFSMSIARPDELRLLDADRRLLICKSSYQLKFPACGSICTPSDH